MPLPEHVQRVVICPACRTERVTRAHPNVTIRCAECGEHFRVYTDSQGPAGNGPQEPSPAPEGEAGDRNDTAAPTAEPSPQPPPVPADPGADFVDIVGPVTFPTADPPPVGDRPAPTPTPEDGPAEPSDQPPPLVDEPSAQGDTMDEEPGGWRHRWRK